MADDVELVRITHKELSSVTKYEADNDDRSNRVRKKKRPDLAIYTPVHRRQNPQPQANGESALTHEKPDESQISDNAETPYSKDNESSKSRPKSKRPDRGVYLPKRRMKGEIASDKKEKEDSDPIQDSTPPKSSSSDKINPVTSPPVDIPSVSIDWGEEVEKELYGTPDDTATFLDAYERSGWTDPSVILEKEKAEETPKVEEKVVPSVPRPLTKSVVFERSKPPLHSNQQGVHQHGHQQGGHQHGHQQGGHQHGHLPGGHQHGHQQGGHQHGHLQGGKQHGHHEGSHQHGHQQGSHQHGHQQGSHQHGHQQGGQQHGHQEGSHQQGHQEGGHHHGHQQGGQQHGHQQGGHQHGHKQGQKQAGHQHRNQESGSHGNRPLHGHRGNQPSHNNHGNQSSGHTNKIQEHHTSSIPPRFAKQQQERHRHLGDHHGNRDDDDDDGRFHGDQHQNGARSLHHDLDSGDDHHTRRGDHDCHVEERKSLRSRRGRPEQSRDADSTDHVITEHRSRRNRRCQDNQHSNGPEQADSDHGGYGPDSARPLVGRQDMSPLLNRDTPDSSPGSSPAGSGRGAGRGRRPVAKDDDQLSNLVKTASLNDQKPGVIVIPKQASPSPIGRGRGRARKLYDPDNPSPPQSQNLPPLHFKEIDPTAETPVPPPFHQRVPPVPIMHMAMGGVPMYPPYMPIVPPPPLPEHFQQMYEASMAPPTNMAPPTAGDRRRSEMLRAEVCSLEQVLYDLTSRRMMPDTNMEMNRRRIEMTMKCEELILNDAESAQKWSIDQVMWKSVYYNMVDVYRHLDHDDQQLKSGLTGMLDEGISFYSALLNKLEHRYDFCLQNYIIPDRPRPEGESRLVKFSLVIAQALMLNLGDLYRYKDDLNQAKSWYHNAQLLMPKNSQPYNRLAVLATNSKKWLDAVYYNMRSYEAVNANLAAREALVSMFDEVRRKAEHERRKLDSSQTTDSRPGRSRDPGRVEVWIAPDGSKETDKSESATTVYKRFILNYLYAHGKLYSKTGLDELREVCQPLYADLERVLTMEQCPLDQDRLFKIIIINIFIIHHTGPVDQKRFAGLLRQDYSLVLGLDLFSIILNRFLTLLREHVASAQYPDVVMTPRLSALCPAIKVWMDWMTSTQRLWNPPPTEDLGSSHDVWVLLAELGTLVEKIDISHVKFLPDWVEGCEALVLPEDVMTEGFKPLMALVRNVPYVHSTCTKEDARACLRVHKLQTFCEFLSGLVPAVLRFSVDKRCYFSAVEHYIYSDGSESSGTTQSEESEEEEEVVVEEEVEDDTGDAAVQKLKQRKQQLQKHLSEINQQNSDRQAVLEQERGRGVVLEIRPVFLVPDTNCFIDHMEALVQILATKRYTIVVPLVVINELDNLARGQERPAVMKVARKVVTFLDNEFEREPRLKAMTSKGSVLETIAYRSETIDDKGNNDDLILSCCLHYCKDRAKDFMPKSPDEPVKLFREVVLLTDDRNLCLKAHTRNVPVRDVLSFMDYAGLSCVDT